MSPTVLILMIVGGTFALLLFVGYLISNAILKKDKKREKKKVWY